MPARRAAPATAFCTDASFRSWRLTTPLRGSIEVMRLGNTHCQLQACDLLGNLMANALGIHTLPSPSATSRAWRTLTRPGGP